MRLCRRGRRITRRSFLHGLGRRRRGGVPEREPHKGLLTAVDERGGNLDPASPFARQTDILQFSL